MLHTHVQPCGLGIHLFFIILAKLLRKPAYITLSTSQEANYFKEWTKKKMSTPK